MSVLKQQQAPVEEHVALVEEHVAHRLVQVGAPVDAGGRTRVQRRACVGAAYQRRWGQGEAPGVSSPALPSPEFHGLRESRTPRPGRDRPHPC